MTSVGDFLIERLRAWGVRRIFGYPGDGINGIIAAIARAGDGVDFIQVRHEEMAAFMATAHAKFTGDVGVALATSGPGAIHLLNGLYDAKADHVPVVAIVGQSATSSIGGEYQQEVDLASLFKDVASAYLVTVTNPAQMRHAVDRAVRIALAERTVTAIVVPKDVQEEKAVPNPPHVHGAIQSGLGYAAPRTIPFDDDLRAAADILNAGKRVALLVGAGAIGAEDAVVAVADRLGAGCAKALLGKSAVSDDHPWVTGTLGLLGTRASSDMISDCDTLLMVGTNFPYSEFLPKQGSVKAVQIDIDARRLGLRFPVDLNLVGDSGETLRALLPLLERKPDSGWRERIARSRADEARVTGTRAEIAPTAGTVNPEYAMMVLDARLPDRAIVTCDAGTTTNFAARHLHMRAGMKFSLSGGLATMGSAVPYAIAAKFAFPDRPVLALTGDGAMQMNGMAELVTIARYWKRWADPRLIVMVSNNRDLNQVTWELRIETGAPDFPGAQHLPDVPYAAFAELLGFRGIRVERADDLPAAWDRALASDRPVVLDVLTDPNHAMLPPHISLEQAKQFMSAFAHGDPETVPALAQSIKSVLASVLPKPAGDEPGR
ncbi:MAG: thiamine pyrophosphate-requiring protein [Candidatus Eremiobacteraeota bacterium]|nr:thiamine pyrophosphate-requiring protein [Candidatus Eremiobacteraeota bacterium]